MPGMSDERKKPGVGFWTTMILVTVLVLYPLSWLAVSFLYSVNLLPDVVVGPARIFYLPIAWISTRIIELRR